MDIPCYALFPSLLPDDNYKIISQIDQDTGAIPPKAGYTANYEQTPFTDAICNYLLVYACTDVVAFIYEQVHLLRVKESLIHEQHQRAGYHT